MNDTMPRMKFFPSFNNVDLHVLEGALGSAMPVSFRLRKQPTRKQQSTIRLSKQPNYFQQGRYSMLCSVHYRLLEFTATQLIQLHY